MMTCQFCLRRNQRSYCPSTVRRTIHNQLKYITGVQMPKYRQSNRWPTVTRHGQVFKTLTHAAEGF